VQLTIVPINADGTKCRAKMLKVSMRHLNSEDRIQQRKTSPNACVWFATTMRETQLNATAAMLHALPPNVYEWVVSADNSNVQRARQLQDGAGVSVSAVNPKELPPAEDGQFFAMRGAFAVREATSQEGDEGRADAVDQVRADEVQILCCTEVFEVGMNIPSSLVMMRNQRSVSSFVQKVGRAGREGVDDAVATMWYSLEEQKATLQDMQLGVALAEERVRAHSKTPFTNRLTAAAPAPAAKGNPKKAAAKPPTTSKRRRMQTATAGANPVQLTAEFETCLSFAKMALASAQAMHRLVYSRLCRGVDINNHFQPRSCALTSRCGNCDNCAEPGGSGGWKDVELSKRDTAELHHALHEVCGMRRCSLKDVTDSIKTAIANKKLEGLPTGKVAWAIDNLVASGWLAMTVRCDWIYKPLGRNAEACHACIYDGGTVVVGVKSRDVHYEYHVAMGGGKRVQETADAIEGGLQKGLVVRTLA